MAAAGRDGQPDAEGCLRQDLTACIIPLRVVPAKAGTPTQIAFVATLRLLSFAQ